MSIKTFLNECLGLTTVAELNEITEYFISILKRGDSDFSLCDICQHQKPCVGRSCKEFCEGDEVINSVTNEVEKFHWTCMDFDYGDCPMMETHCSGCLGDYYANFEWEGLSCERDDD